MQTFERDRRLSKANNTEQLEQLISPSNGFTFYVVVFVLCLIVMVLVESFQQNIKIIHESFVTP